MEYIRLYKISQEFTGAGGDGGFVLEFQRFVLSAVYKKMSNAVCIVVYSIQYNYLYLNMKVQNKKDILLQLRKHRGNLRNFGLEQIGLFGSFVKDEQKRDSDVDLLVKFDRRKKTFRNFIRAAAYIESLLGRKMEVVTPESLSPYIAPYIKQEAEYVQIAN